MKRPSILIATMCAASVLAACGTTDSTTDDDPSATPTADADASDEPTEDGVPSDTDDDGAAGGDIQPATVALTFDGQRVPIAEACNGVDGAVLATTEGEVTITLVREEGLALRYNGEGMTAETTDVETEEVGVSSIYRATLESDDVPAVDVVLELGDTSELPDC